LQHPGPSYSQRAAEITLKVTSRDLRTAAANSDRMAGRGPAHSAHQLVVELILAVWGSSSKRGEAASAIG